MINNIVHIVSLKKEAIYFNNKLFTQSNNISLSNISDLFYISSPFKFSKIKINKSIKDFPNNISEIIKGNVNNFEIGDDITFTVKKNKKMYYGKGIIENIEKDGNENVIGYKIKEKDSDLNYSISIENENETIYFSSCSSKYKADFKILSDIVEQRRKILTPKVGEYVKFKTDKEVGEGIVKSIYIHNEYKLKYRCIIEKNNGEMIEVYMNNKRYPLDNIVWESNPLLEDGCMI